MLERSANIRVASPSDAQDIVAIYAPNITDAIVSFELEVPTLDAMRGRIAETLVTHPWLVWEESGKVVAYAYASKHRERAAYQWSTDVSCYVHREARGRGVGKALYRELLHVLRGQGFVNAYAGIALPNAASVRLHEAVGFEFLGVYRGVGFKQGEWRDVGWWHCRLGDAPATPQPPRPFTGLA
jgi:phosphinothricin acetyltransferase